MAHMLQILTVFFLSVVFNSVVSVFRLTIAA